MIETGQNLTESLTTALEKQAFMMVLPMEDQLTPPTEPFLSEIHFSGPRCGTLQIMSGREFSTLLARNISAGMDEDTEACLDALRELSNVTCGLLLPALSCCQSDIFDVTVPTVAWGEKSMSWVDFTSDPGSIILNVEGCLVAVRLILQGETIHENRTLN